MPKKIFFNFLSALEKTKKKLRNDSGVSLIEFAILMPTFILLMFGIIHMAVIMILQNALEAAVREAGRYGTTGQVQSGQTRAQSINQKIRDVCNTFSGGIIDPQKLIITVEAYPDLTEISAGKGAQGSFGLPGQAVLYNVSYPWDTLMPIFGSSNIITIKARTPVVNEQFTPVS